MTRTKNHNREHTPLDFAILAVLPNEGATVGLRNVGKSIRGLTREMQEQDETITSPSVNASIRRLFLHGLVARVAIMPISEGLGWQISKKGHALLKQKGVKHTLNGTKEVGGGSDG